MKRGALKWQPTEPASVNARQTLPKLVHDYFKAGRRLDGDSSPRDMHRFRLMTKRLRYTLEAFLPLYGPGLKTKVALLRPIQNALGDLNDCRVLLAQMGGELPHEVKTHVSKRADEKHKEFLQYWRDQFDAAGEDKKWQQYLKRFTRRLPAPAQASPQATRKAVSKTASQPAR